MKKWTSRANRPQIIVGIDLSVAHRGEVTKADYSVLPEYLGRAIWVRQGTRRVRIFCG